MKFGALATPCGFDWDGDGDTDIVSGNTAGYIAFFENLSGPGVEKPRWAAPKYLEADGKVIRIHGRPERQHPRPVRGEVGLHDADRGRLGRRRPAGHHREFDLGQGDLVSQRRQHDRQPELAAAQPIEVEWDGPQPTLAYGWLRPQGKELLTQWRTTPVAVDWNRDGLVDLVMLDQEGYLAFFQRARRDGNSCCCRRSGCFTARISGDDRGHKPWTRLGPCAERRHRGPERPAQAVHRGLGRRRQARHPASTPPTPISSARWTPATASGFSRTMGLLSEQNIEGHDVSPTVVDFNGDGIPDFLGGAEDGRFYYLRNPRREP